jgi:hypothetical protein
LGEPRASRPFPERAGPGGSLIYRLITTTAHKVIGIMYVVACAFFFVGGLIALLIRAELAAPALQFLSNEQYNQLFTMHGKATALPGKRDELLRAVLEDLIPKALAEPDVSIFPLHEDRDQAGRFIALRTVPQLGICRITLHCRAFRYHL